MRVKNCLLDFFFPESCLFCKSPTSIVCDKCFGEIGFLEQDNNGIKYFYDFKDDRVNKLLWRLKYHHSHVVAEKFGVALSKFLRHLPEGTVILPIPLSKHDTRYHNHSEVLAKSIAHYNKDKNFQIINNIFIKNNKVKQAHTKSRAERFRNMESAFSINENMDLHFSDNSYFIIIDDVHTTGATLQAAKICLIDNYKIDANKLFLLTIAH